MRRPGRATKRPCTSLILRRMPRSRLATAEGEAEKLPVALKAEGGTLPLTWLVDGVPLQSSPHRRDAFLKPSGPGFVQITVVDAEGRSDRTQIRLH